MSRLAIATTVWQSTNNKAPGRESRGPNPECDCAATRTMASSIPNPIGSLSTRKRLQASGRDSYCRKPGEPRTGEIQALTYPLSTWSPMGANEYPHSQVAGADLKGEREGTMEKTP